jgi:hypothetical protein
MKEKYFVLIFIIATSIVASVFIYTLKTIEKKEPQTKSRSYNKINGAKNIYKTDENGTEAGLLNLSQEDINSSIVDINETLLSNVDVNVMKESAASSEDYALVVEEDAAQTTVFNKNFTLDEIEKRKNKDKNVEDSSSGDDASAQLEEIISDRDRLLNNENIPEWIKEGIRGLNVLKYEYNLDIGISYRGVAQYESVSDTFGSGGNLDIFGIYKSTPNSSFGFNLRSRNNYGGYSSKEYSDKIGSIYPVSPSHENLSPYVTEFWYQYIFDDLRVRFGFLNRNSFIDNSFYKNQNRYFLSHTFSHSPYNSLPENGPGVVLKYKKPSYYTLAYFADADVKKGESLGNIIDRDFKLYSALEFGLTPEDGLYYITLWDKDSKDNKKEKNQGAIFSFNHILENEYKVFAKYAVSTDALEEEHISVGIGRKDLYKTNDLLSVAVGYAKPNEDYRAQSTTEIFYRYEIYYGVQFTTSMQFIYHPSKSDETWAVLPGVRVRVAF